MKFTLSQKSAGELTISHLSDKAQEFYNNTDPLDVYEVETDEGNRYFVRGCYEFENMTLSELEKAFEDAQKEIDALNAED